MGKIEDISTRILRSMYNESTEYGYLTETLCNAAALVLYKYIYSDDQIAESFLNEHIDYPPFEFFLDWFGKYSVEYTEYIHPVPFDRYRYNITLKEIIDFACMAQCFKYCFRTSSASYEYIPDRYPDYAFMFMVFLEEWHKIHPSEY